MERGPRLPFGHLAPAVARGSVQVVLSDHHYWGGLHRSRLLSGILARLHEQYIACGLRDRDATGYMQRIDPSYEKKTPRW